MTQGDIHNRSRTLERLSTQIQKNPEIPERDKKILVEGNSTFPSFLTYMQNKNHSTSRINRYLRTWKNICEHTSWKIEEVDKTKIAQLIGDLNTDKITKMNGDPYSPATKREIKKGVRKMFTDYAESYSKELKLSDDFRGDEIINFTLTIDQKYTDPDRLPTPYTVKTLVENASRLRDKAYIMLLWSTGGRHGEVLGLKWKDVDFTGKIGTVTFRDTKTGGDHTVPMAESYPFMKNLKEKDEKGHKMDEYVFRSTQSNNQLSANGASNIIERSRDEEEIPDKIKTNPHAFRKGRTVYWIRQGKNEAWICKHMNWVPGSNVVVHYARVAKEDVEKGVAKHLGLEQEHDEREEHDVLTPSECHVCGEICSFQADVCSNCGKTLSTSEMYEEQKIQEATDELVFELAVQESSYDEEDIKEKAKELVQSS